jgi:hypothetical protein
MVKGAPSSASRRTQNLHITEQQFNISDIYLVNATDIALT